MTVREYIGARYVPLFMGEWDNTKTYEPLSIVLHQGDSYTSRQFVPVGIDIDNEQYWFVSGNFNAQIEAYRQEVAGFNQRITDLDMKFPIANDDITDNAIATRNIQDASIVTSKLANNAVTTAKIADANVTTAKIADANVTKAKLSTSLQASIDNIDELALKTMSFENMKGSWRIPVEINDIRHNLQGCVSFQRDNKLYTVIFLCNDDIDGWLISFVNGVEVSRKYTTSLAHGNSMACKGYDVYIPNNNTRIMYKVSVSKNGALSDPVDSGISIGGNLVYDSRLDKFYQISESAIDEVNFNSRQPITHTPANFNGPVNNKPTGQSAALFYINNKKYYAYLFSMPNMISICDENGQFVCYKELPYYTNYVCLGEPEGVTIFDNGDFVLFSNEPNQDTMVTKTCYAFEGNMFSETGSFFTKENATSSTYVFAYPSSLDTYNFPTTNNGTVSGSNPIKISYMQDCQYINNATKAKNMDLEIMEDGTAKNGLVLSSVNAHVGFNKHILSACEFRHCTVEAMQTQQHMDETRYDNQRIRAIECPLFVTRYTSNNPKALYANGSVVGITSSMNSVIQTTGNCFVINPDV